MERAVVNGEQQVAVLVATGAIPPGSIPAPGPGRLRTVCRFGRIGSRTEPPLRIREPGRVLLRWLNGQTAGQDRPAGGAPWRLTRMTYTPGRMTAEFTSASGSVTCVIEPSGS